MCRTVVSWYLNDILAAPWVVGPITFGAPAMLWGALAAAGPILVHLVFRTRARRVPLPTVQFVLRMQQQTQSRQRLKHLVLLLLRMLGILLLVAVLARPTLKTRMFAAASREPVEAVLCLDDSASMDYRSQNKSRFEAGRTQLVRLLRDHSRFPVGSRAALLTGSRPAGATRLSLDLDTLRVQAERLEVGQHDRGLGDMLKHAYTLLDEGVLPVREIYVISDLTQQAWRDVPQGAFTARKDVHVYCIDVGVDHDTNVALLDPIAPARSVPEGSAAGIQLGLRAGGIGGRLSLEVLLDATPRWRLGPIQVERGGVLQKDVLLSDLTPGIHQGEIRLVPDDPLGIDNVRYFTIHVGPLQAVAVIGAPNSLVADIVSAMIAPPDLPNDQQRTRLSRIGIDELARDRDLSRYAAVVLADVPALPQTAVAALSGFLQNGGAVIVVPGPAFQPAGYAQAEPVMPALPTRVVTPKQPGHVTPSTSPDTVLAPFQGDSGLSLSEPAVRRYVQFAAPLAGGRVLARMEDGAAAIVVRPIGRGVSVALAFSPVRTWSDFAIDAGPMLVLLNTVIADGLPHVRQACNLRVGQITDLPLPQAPANDRESKANREEPAGRRSESVTITSPTRRESWTVAVGADGGAVRAVTDRTGHYRVHRADAQAQTDVAYSVNTPASESNLQRMSVALIEARFAPGTVTRVERLDALGASKTTTGTATHALTGWLAIILLGILMAESFLSNRFHRQPSAEQDAAAEER